MAEAQVTVLSPAKVNLTLEVGPRRPDGYHEIDSVVQTIDLCDVLIAQRAPKGVLELTVEGADITTGRDNFVLKAAELFLEITRAETGVRFHLVKHIPVQAGLGGGSSNAVAALFALNALCRTCLSKDSFARMAAEVSSDSALFVWGGTLRIRGRGEIVRQLPDGLDLHFVIVKPEYGVSTMWAYEQLDRFTGCRIHGWSERAEAAVLRKDTEELIQCLYNDFDSAIAWQLPEIRDIQVALVECGAIRSLLCGSGSAVFGVFESGCRAQDAVARLSGRFAKVLASRTFSRAELARFAVSNE